MVARARHHPEQVLHQRRQTILGYELKGREIDHDGGNPLAILHRRSYPIGMLAGADRAAGSTPAAMRAMFGHHQRRRIGKIKDLPCDIAVPGALRQRLGAVVAGWGKVIDDTVGIDHRREGLPRMIRLAAGCLL